MAWVALEMCARALAVLTHLQKSSVRALQLAGTTGAYRIGKILLAARFSRRK